LVTERENRKPYSGKRKKNIQSEWKINETKLLRNTAHLHKKFKLGTEIPECRILSHVGSFVG